MSGSITPGTEQDRRRHHRVQVSAPASFKLSDTFGIARCLNLSVGGAGLRTRGSVRSGSVVNLKLSLRTGQVHTLAEVVRAKGTDVGVRFVNLDPTSLAAIVSNIW